MYDTMGENITSFLQLGRIMWGPFGDSTSFSNSYKTYILNTLNYTQLRAADANSMLVLDYIHCAYGFFKGSLSVRIHPQSLSTDRVFYSTWVPSIPVSCGARLAVIPSDGTTLPTETNMYVPPRSVPLFRNLEGMLHVRIPSYNPYSILRNSPTALEQSDTEPKAHSLCITVAKGEYLNFFMSFGDDRRCYQPVGLPPFRRIRPGDLYSSPVN